MSTVFTFSLLFLASLLLRLSLISAGPYHVDCLNIALKAQETLATGQLSFALGFGYPLMVLLSAAVMAIFHLFGISDPVMAVNFLSALMGSLAVGMFYLFGRRFLEDERAAVFGAFLFSTSPIFLATSVYGMNHAPAVCFLLVSLYFLFKYFQSRNIRDLFCAGVFLACMGATRTQDMVLVLPAMLVCFWHSPSRGSARIKELIVFGMVTLIVLGLFHINYLSAGARAAYAGQVHTYWQEGLIANFQGFLTPNMKRAVGYNFSLASFLLSLFGLALLLKRRLKSAIFLLVWFLVPLFFLGNLLMIRPRFFIVLIPAVMTVQGYALSGLARSGPWARRGAALIVVLLAVLQAWTVWPGIAYRHRHARIVEFTQWVGEKTPPNAQVIAGDEGAFIVQYAKRELLPKPICTHGCSPEKLEQFGRKLDDILKVQPVYITDIALWADNDRRDFNDFMTSRYDLKLLGQKTYEDWHSDCFVLVTWKSEFYKVEPK